MKILLLLIFTFNLAYSQKNTDFFKDKTKIENPFNLRDPFKPNQVKNESKRAGRGFEVSGKGNYSNIAETPLHQIQLSQLKLVGVLIGKERRAMVSSGDKKVIILKEGMKIGPEAAELKAILPGGIVLVEKIVNVYGEEEYLETVIPISR